MKNKFLLLGGIAATAVISATNYAQADIIAANFDVKVKFMANGPDLIKAQDLDFGSVRAVKIAAGSSITVNTDGTYSVDGGNLNHYGNQKPAIVYSDGSYSEDHDVFDINVSGDRELKTPGQNGKLCGYVSDWEHEKFEYSPSGTATALGFKIGATFTLPSADDWEIDDEFEEDINCSATATATLIYTGGANSGN